MFDNDRRAREDYRYWMAIPIRFSDNDMLGHVNNVLYFRYFEAIVVQFLVEQAGLRWDTDPVVPFAAEVLCRFKRPLTYPGVVDAGLSIGRIGGSSVTYALGLFAGDEPQPAALGHFVHVYVDRGAENTAPIPDPIRAVYERYV